MALPMGIRPYRAPRADRCWTSPAHYRAGCHLCPWAVLAGRIGCSCDAPGRGAGALGIRHTAGRRSMRRRTTAWAEPSGTGWSSRPRDHREPARGERGRQRGRRGDRHAAGNRHRERRCVSEGEPAPPAGVAAPGRDRRGHQAEQHELGARCDREHGEPAAGGVGVELEQREVLREPGDQAAPSPGRSLHGARLSPPFAPKSVSRSSLRRGRSF